MNIHVLKRIAAHILVGSAGLSLIIGVLLYAIWLLIGRGEISLADQPVLVILFSAATGIVWLSHKPLVRKLAPYPADKYAQT